MRMCSCLLKVLLHGTGPHLRQFVVMVVSSNRAFIRMVRVPGLTSGDRNGLGPRGKYFSSKGHERRNFDHCLV